jgi:putative ABC transport system permease protein
VRRVTLRSIWAHRRRLGSTFLAIVLGVGFMAGTFILSTTLDQAAGDLFKGSADAIDAYVRGGVLDDGGAVAEPTRQPLPATMVDEVRAVEGVLAAEPRVSVRGVGGTNRVLGRGGFPLGAGGGPGTVLESWVADARLTPYRIATGRGPEGDDEVVLDEASARRGGHVLGDDVLIVAGGAPQAFHLVGTFRSGAAESSGGAVSAELSLPAAQRLAGLGDRIDGVFVKAAAGVGEARLAERLRSRLGGPAVDVLTGAEARTELDRNESPDLRFFEVLLAIFGVVSLLVGAFVISNTFSILVGQRTRELALLRTLGASRAQVFASVLAEAATVGVLASAVGLAVGAELATLLNRAMDQIGLQLPAGHLVVPIDTIVTSFVLGVAATLLATLVPALRATRVPPLAALREVQVDRSRGGAGRLALGLAALVAGCIGCAPAWRGQDASTSLATTGLGAVLVVVGLVALGPVLVGFAIAGPRALLQRRRGIAGRLAAENAGRSPRRTASTASAVLISTALVLFVSAFASSALHSVRSDAARGFRGDFLVTGPGGLSLPNGLLSTSISPEALRRVRAVPGVDLAVGMGYDAARLTYPDGATATRFVSSIDRVGLGSLIVPRLSQGEVSDLDDDGILIDRVDALHHHVGVGDTVGYGVGTSRTVRLRVAGISDDPNLLGHATVTRDRYAALAPQVRDVQVAGRFAAGADRTVVLGRIRAVLVGLPDTWVVTRDQFLDTVSDQISTFINVLYALLVLSVLISTVGIANTLSLTIHERTRELGLLRAIGMDRSGVRAAVRWEALVVGAIGMGVGVVAGIGLAYALVGALRDLGLVTFAVPPAGLVAIALGAVGLTVAASLRPARRAAAVSILDAIAAD